MGTGELARAPKASCFKQVVSKYQKARQRISRPAADAGSVAIKVIIEGSGYTQRSVERMTNELKTEALADASINEGLVRWFPNSATHCITPMEVMQA